MWLHHVHHVHHRQYSTHTFIASSLSVGLKNSAPTFSALPSELIFVHSYPELFQCLYWKHSEVLSVIAFNKQKHSCFLITTVAKMVTVLFLFCEDGANQLLFLVSSPGGAVLILRMQAGPPSTQRTREYTTASPYLRFSLKVLFEL